MDNRLQILLQQDWKPRIYTHRIENHKDEKKQHGGGRYLGTIPLLIALVGIIRRPKEALPWLGVATVGVLLPMERFIPLMVK